MTDKPDLLPVCLISGLSLAYLWFICGLLHNQSAINVLSNYALG